MKSLSSTSGTPLNEKSVTHSIPVQVQESVVNYLNLKLVDTKVRLLESLNESHGGVSNELVIQFPETMSLEDAQTQVIKALLR